MACVFEQAFDQKTISMPGAFLYDLLNQAGS
jgi:hypothetical protein